MSYPRWFPNLLRAVDQRLYVGPMGAICSPPAGIAWSGWVDLVEDYVREESPSLAKRRDAVAATIARDALFRTTIKDLVNIPPRVFARSLGVYRAAPGAVLISCAAGVSRSASVAYAILRRAQAMGHADALRRVSVEGWDLEGTPTFESARDWAENR